MVWTDFIYKYHFIGYTNQQSSAAPEVAAALPASAAWAAAAAVWSGLDR